MKKILNYNFHDIVRMKVVINNYNSFLSKTLEQKFAHYLVDEDIKEPEINVQIGPFTPDSKGAFILDEYYHIRENYIFCRHRYKIARWKVEIAGFGNYKTTVRIESNIFGFWVFPGGTIYSILMFKLASSGYAMLHASGVSRAGKAYIFTGRSGTGKTITVFNLLKKGFDYLGDDTTILGGHQTLSFIKPLNIRFTYDVGSILGFSFGKREKIIIFIKKILRIASFGYINLFTKVNVADFFKDRLGSKRPLEKLFFMIQGDDFRIRESRDKKTLAKQMRINTEFESDDLSGYLSAYTHVFPRSGLSHFWNDMEEIIRENIEDRLCYFVDMPKRYSLENFDLLLERINGQESRQSQYT